MLFFLINCYNLFNIIQFLPLPPTHVLWEIIPYLPSITSLLFTSPVVVVSLIHKKRANIYLSIILLLMTFFSFLFWMNPIRNRYSNKHIIDKYFAVFTTTTFILYNLFIKKKNIPLLSASITVMFVFFYLSNYYSRQSWCCGIHIFFHLLAHIFAIICSYFTLI